MSKRLQGIVIGLIASALLAGTVAYAVTVVPSESSDVYYGCFSSLNKLKASTVQVNSQPATCPAATDVVRSWGAQGDAGPVGETGPAGPEGPEGPPGPAVTPEVRVIELSTSDAQRNVVLAPGQTLYYNTEIASSDCRSIGMSVERVIGSGHALLQTGYGEPGSSGLAELRARAFTGSKFLRPFVWPGEAPIDGSLVNEGYPEGLGSESYISIYNSSASNLTIGRAHAYCYPY